LELEAAEMEMECNGVARPVRWAPSCAGINKYDFLMFSRDYLGILSIVSLFGPNLWSPDFPINPFFNGFHSLVFGFP
jgi:hypothetical protein